MMGRGYGGFGRYSMMGGGSFMMILVLIAIGFLFYLAMKSQTPNQKNAYLPPQPHAESEALQIAKSRLAKGEITVEEFEQIKKNLS